MENLKESLLSAQALLMPLLLALTVAALTTHAHAQIYRWVDEDGKVHYGDRPPRDNKKVEDVSDKVKSVNVDTSTAEQQKLNRIFAKETMEEKHAETIREVEEADQRRRLCQQANERLTVVRDHAFYYVDEQGNERDLSKEERNQELARLTDMVNQNCQ